MIDDYETLNEIYRDMLQEHRRLTLMDKAGESICLNCGKVKNSHLPDERCSSSATARKFFDENRDKICRTEKAMLLIEELKTL